MQWFKNNVRMLLYMILILALGVWGGFTLRDMQMPKSETPAQTPIAEPVSQIGEASILPDTEVTMRYTFLLCGHTLEQHQTGGPLIGNTLEDITTSFPDARVQELNGKRAIIERELERYCPAHILLFLDGAGNLCISHTDETDYEKDVVTTLTYDVSGLPEEVISLLEEGMVFDSLEQVNAYLEDVES